METKTSDDEQRLKGKNSHNVFKLSLAQCKLDKKREKQAMNKTQISNRSNTSSLFSDENDNRNKGSTSPAKRLYKEDQETKQCEEDQSDSDKDRSKNNSLSNKKVEFNKPIIPPPLSLLPKSQIPNEPIRTGGPIQFLKLTFAKGGSNILVEKQDSKDIKEKIKESEEIESHKGKRAFKSMFYQELRGCDRNPIVFDRFSKTTYDPDEKLPEELVKPSIVNIK